MVSVNGSRVTVRRPSDGRLFMRNSNFVRRYFGSSMPCDFVEPMLSVPCNEEAECNNVRSASEPADVPADRTQASEYRTRIGRVIVKPQWYGNVVSY